MARPKCLEDSKAIELIKQYFNNECDGDAKKLSTTNIVVYINQHGYPKYNAAILRRSPNVTAYIDELKNTAENDDYVTTVSYQTLDAISFVERNRSRDSLIKAITERDTYYKTISDSAARSFERYNSVVSKYEDEVIKRKNLELKTSKDEELLKEYRASIRELKKELKTYKTLVDTYVYPEMANELLAREGAIKLTKNIVDPEAVNASVISTGTNIRKLHVYDDDVDDGIEEKPAATPESNIISNLFI